MNSETLTAQMVNKAFDKESYRALPPTPLQLATLLANIRVMLWSLTAGKSTPENQQTRREYQDLNAALSQTGPLTLSASQLSLLITSLETCEAVGRLGRLTELGPIAEDLSVDRVADALAWVEANSSPHSQKGRDV